MKGRGAGLCESRAWRDEWTNLPSCPLHCSFWAGAPINTAYALTLVTLDDAPRVLDTDLAAALGMDRPRNIRVNVIEPNREEIEGFGGLLSRQANPGPKGGRPATAYYLNRQQALLVCILSRTPKAVEVRREVIRRFDAYEGLV